jgi:uracil-DNA glycosylase family 4
MEWLDRLSKAKSLPLLDKEIIGCRKCPRLVQWREEVAVVKRKSYEDQNYWGKPVPGFGPSDARIVIVGLAPGAHGANRTGRIFTGDSSGDWLYKALHKVGLATMPTSTSAVDGQKLLDTRITCAVRCAPPDNKPSTEEKSQCSDYLVNEIELLMPTARTFVALGSFAWSAVIKTLRTLGHEILSPTPEFGHGESFTWIAPDGIKRLVLGSYHPSQQNTFTGKLTEPMLNAVFKKAKSFK